LAEREIPLEDFRVGNFWAWHVKEDFEKSMYEARRELVFRAELLPPKYDMVPYVTEEERALVIEKWANFAKAFWTRSGVIEDVPEDIVNRLVAACSSAGDLSAVDEQIERFKVFEKAGLTELSIRLFDDPMEGLKLWPKTCFLTLKSSKAKRPLAPVSTAHLIPTRLALGVILR
jgi:hypothetical protein